MIESNYLYEKKKYIGNIEINRNSNEFEKSLKLELTESFPKTSVLSPHILFSCFPLVI